MAANERLRHFGAGKSHFGEDTKGHDLRVYGDTTAVYAEWDASSDHFKFEDNAKLVFGTGTDVTVRWDGTDLDILAAANNSVIKFGNGTNSFDLWVYGATNAKYLLWDASADKLIATGLVRLVFDNPTYNAAGSYQNIESDLTLGTAAGTSDAGDSDFLAPIMGNIQGANLTKTNNYIGGGIFHYTVTGTNASVYPVGAVLAGIGDQTTTADGAVVAYIDGDGGVTTANAAFKYMMNNSTAGSGVDFGLDLFSAAHSGYLEAAILKADIRLSKEVCIFQGAGVPTDGVAGTGNGFAEIGSLYLDRTNGNAYLNAGTKASPTWKLVTRAA